MFTRLLLVALLGVGLACAKTYSFSLSDTAQAGSTTLKAGDYHVKVQGSNVVIKDAEGHDVATKAKIEKSDKPYPATEVSTNQSNGMPHIEWIGLANSKSKIVFE